MLSSSARASEGSSNGVCPVVTIVARVSHRVRRVDRHDLAGNQPIEQVADRGKPLLDARRGQLARRHLDPRRDMHRLDIGDRRHPDARAPGQEFLRSAEVGPARVRIANVGGKEFEEAHRGALADGCDERRRQHG
jgi:hypothetical protein